MKAIIILIILAIIVILLYVAATNMEPGTIKGWAIIATLAIPIAFVGGVIVGNLEARGKISGIDLAMDKLGHTYDHATKTMADIERRRKPPPAPTVQIMNGMPDGRLLPPISHRQITDDEVIDL